MAWAVVTARSGGGLEATPDRLDAAADNQRLLPAIGELVAVRPGDGVLRRPKLAEKAQRVVGAGARPPQAEALLPPAGEEIEPLLVLREGDLHLDLLAARDAALEGIGTLENAADEGVVLGRDRVPELTVEQVMREIGAEPHLGHRVEQQQRREEIVGDAVAVSLELNLDAF